MNHSNSSMILNFAMLKEEMAENMLPALIQCFGIILIGYIFGRSKILNLYGTKGLCLFLQYLSLPTLIFMSLATISISNVKWDFIAAILVAKTIVFIVAAVTTMILTKPINLGKAGMYAIASTQSNDLALGYPLMTSLYKNTHPTFPTILYVVVPIQLLILNPAGFFLLEVYKRRMDTQYSRHHSMFIILKEFIKNPMIISTILGIAWNFAFHHQVSPIIGDLLTSLGTVFSPLALFLLGHSMSCGIKALKGYFSLTPAIIVLTKILILPLILQKITELFLRKSIEQDLQDFSSLGFLYGTIPSAPTIFIFAKQYNVAVNVIASVTVYSTLFSAPLMLTSATMIALAQTGFEDIKDHLKDTVTYLSAVNFCCCLLVLILFTIKKKWKDVCAISVMYIIIAQLLMSVGGILYFFNYLNHQVLFYAQYVLSLGGLILTRLFAVFFGILIFLLQKRSLCYVLRYKLFINIIVGLVIPLTITAILVVSLMITSMPSKTWNVDFQFNYAQVMVVLFLTFFTLLLSVVFLILQHKYMKDSMINENTEISSVRQQLLTDHNQSHSNLLRSQCDCDTNYLPEMSASDIEDVAQEFEEITHNVQEHVAQQKKYFKHTCDSRYDCNDERRIQCSSQIENYKDNMPVLNIEVNDEYVKYVIIILSLLSSMLISIMVCISWLITKNASGICIELKFLDAILSYGQGIIILMLFGINDVINFIRRCLNFRRRQNEHLIEEDPLIS